MRIPRVSPKNLTGFLDKVIGLGKEFVGDLLNDRSLVQAGEAQQDKGTEKLKALRSQLEADSHEAAAEVHETRQKLAAGAK
jgi:uncharacterized protein YjbJ (UPF0337 family)